MDALTRYLSRHAESFDQALLQARPSSRLYVVIPALAESAEDVERVLTSLGPPGGTFEVIVVVNRSEDASEDVLEKNRRLSSALKRHPVIVLEKVFAAGTAGVGAARRTGMDLALRRLVASGRFEDGVIACLDADSPVSEGYAKDLVAAFEKEHPAAVLCACHHRVPEEPERAEAIVLYELWLRYLQAGFNFAGSPYRWLPIGSTMAVSAGAYVAVQGMPRLKAAEDFHFLNKVAKACGWENVRNLEKPVVYPSPRVSDRVPFGTGKAMNYSARHGAAFLKSVEPVEAFRILRRLFEALPEGFDDPRAILSCSELLEEFLQGRNFDRIYQHLRNNSSGTRQFVRSFLGWFDALQQVRFLRFCKKRIGPQNVLEAIESLGHGKFDDPHEALRALRRFSPPRWHTPPEKHPETSGGVVAVSGEFA